MALVSKPTLMAIYIKILVFSILKNCIYLFDLGNCLGCDKGIMT